MRKRYLIAIIIAVELAVGLALAVSFRDLLHERANQPAAGNAVNTAAPAAEQVTIEPAAFAGASVGDSANAATGPTVLDGETAPVQPSSANVPAAVFTLFQPLPAQAPSLDYERSEALIALGRTLWYDPRLSASQQMSCNTCHPLSQHGADNLPRSLGHRGDPVRRNAQTVYNAALHVAQFWDGRSPTVEHQAMEPITSAAEMGMLDPAWVEALLGSIPGYALLFAAAFPSEANSITYDNVGTAIGAFERGLLTPSRFDDFLAGDASQLTDAEQQGLTTFVEVGCTGCHLGTTVGGLFYKKLGEIIPYSTQDPGRYEVTGSEDDRHVFKVPSLRNVTRTAPYLHDGSIATLDEMIALMGRHQLGKELSEQEIGEIMAFLHALTGEIPLSYVAEPQLPASGPNTPGPQLE